MKPVTELAAIWIRNPMPIVDGKRKSRFAPGDPVCIKDGEVDDGTSTHIVSKCYQDSRGDLLYMVVTPKEGGDNIVVKLKVML